MTPCKSKWEVEVLKENDLIRRVELEKANKIMEVLVQFTQAGWFDSNSQLRRLLDSKAVKVRDKVYSFNEDVELRCGDVIQLGRIRFVVSNLLEE